MTIRPATPADAAAIAHIHVASWQATYAGLVPDDYLQGLEIAEFTARWQTRLTAEAPPLIRVAESGGDPLGFASGGPIRQAVASFGSEMYALYLLPAAQRQGTGRALFHLIANQLAAAGDQGLLLWSLRDNPSTGFYERLGGTPVAESTLEIGGRELATRAYGWPSLSSLSPNVTSQPRLRIRP